MILRLLEFPKSLLGVQISKWVTKGPPAVVHRRLWYFHFLSQVQRAAHPHTRPGHYVRVNLRRGHVHVPEQILQRTDIHPRFQQMGRERMALMPSSA